MATKKTRKLPKPRVCIGVGWVPSTLQGVVSGTTVGQPPQPCDICGATQVPVDGMFRLTLHEDARTLPSELDNQPG